MAGFSEHMPLHEARRELMKRVDDGLDCPCCGQHAKVYKRKLNETMVRALAKMVLAADKDTRKRLHGPTVLDDDAAAARELGKLAYFELLEDERDRREDGGHSGHWYVTDRGVAFMEGRAKVYRYAHVYNGRVIERSGPAQGVREVAPRFDLRELMAGV